MNAYGLMPVLVVVLFGAQSDQVWPDKGDLVFIAARFTDLEKSSADLGVRGYILKSNLEPCSELLVEQADLRKSRWAVKHSLWGTFQLEGPWVSRMHKTKAECVEQIAAAGEAKVKRSGRTFKIAPATSTSTPSRN